MGPRRREGPQPGGAGSSGLGEPERNRICRTGNFICRCGAEERLTQKESGARLYDSAKTSKGWGGLEGTIGTKGKGDDRANKWRM